MALHQRQTVGAEVLAFINVADGRHERAHHHFGMVLEEVDLGREGRSSKGLQGTGHS